MATCSLLGLSDLDKLHLLVFLFQRIFFFFLLEKRFNGLEYCRIHVMVFEIWNKTLTLPSPN